MMVSGRMKGKRLGYRPLGEFELSNLERDRVYSAQHRASQLNAARGNLIRMARNDRQGFDIGARWVVATCRVGWEIEIAEDLERQGITCWCPIVTHRRPPKRGLKAVDIHRPVFRGYVFVKIIPDAEAVTGLLSASYLRGLMGVDGRPFAVPERLMFLLRLGVKAPDIADLSYPIRVGNTVDIRSGPFVNFQVTIRRILGEKGKLECEAALFGRMTQVTIDIDDVKI